MTHFELLSLAPTFDVDPNLLEARYRELSKQLHPDRSPGADPKARRLSVERTAALNEAYRVLRDPARRALYLLRLAGVDLGREDGEKLALPEELLEEQLRLREELAEARKRKDHPKARAMAEIAWAQRGAALEEAAKALRLLSAKAGDASALEAASRELARVRYFTRFLEEVEVFEEEAGE